MNKLIKHGLLMGIVVMLVIGTLLTSCAPQPTGPIKLRYAGHMPPNNPVTLQQLRFAEEVGKRTEVDVTIETYIAGELYKAEQLADAVSTGAIEMVVGSSNLSFGPRSPLFGVGNLFFLPGSPGHVGRAKDEIGKILLPLFEKHNVKVIHWVPYSGLAYGGPEPVIKPEDIKGKVVRVPGAAFATLELLGAVPASMPSSEVYDALAKGALDGAMSGWSSQYTRKWYEVADYMSGPFNSSLWVAAMNLDTWKGLPKDVQKVLMEVGKETEEWAFGDATAQDAEYVELLKKEGVNVTVFSAQQIAAWTKVTQPATDKWLAECEKAGYGSEGKKILEILEKTR